MKIIVKVILGTIILEQALSMLALPREIGPHPVTGKIITANNGRFGPYVKHENTFANIKGEEEDIFTIGINRAVDFISWRIFNHTNETMFKNVLTIV